MVFTKQFQTRSSSRFGRRRWIPTAVRNSGGKPTWFDGYLYPSITEAHCAILIKDKQRRGEYTWVRRQVLLPMIVGGRWHAQDYTMDFVAGNEKGRLEFYEAKGYQREFWKGRWPFVIALLMTAYPGCRVWRYDSDGALKLMQPKDARRVKLEMPVFDPSAVGWS